MCDASTEGRSCAQPVDPWYAVRKVPHLERVGIERDLVGIPVAEIPSALLTAADGTPEAEIRKRYYRTVTSLLRNEHEGLVWCSCVFRPIVISESGRS